MAHVVELQRPTEDGHQRGHGARLHARRLAEVRAAQQGLTLVHVSHNLRHVSVTQLKTTSVTQKRRLR